MSAFTRLTYPFRVLRKGLRIASFGDMAHPRFSSGRFGRGADSIRHRRAMPSRGVVDHGQLAHWILVVSMFSRDLLLEIVSPLGQDIDIGLSSSIFCDT